MKVSRGNESGQGQRRWAGEINVGKGNEDRHWAEEMNADRGNKGGDD